MGSLGSRDPIQQPFGSLDRIVSPDLVELLLAIPHQPAGLADIILPQAPDFAPQETSAAPRFYSWDILSSTGNSGRVMKMRVPESISRATALNSPSPTV